MEKRNNENCIDFGFQERKNLVLLKEFRFRYYIMKIERKIIIK